LELKEKLVITHAQPLVLLPPALQPLVVVDFMDGDFQYYVVVHVGFDV